MLDKNKPISYFNDVNRRTQTISELEGLSSHYYTGIGSEIREDAINNATKVVVNLPQGLGRYDIASASEPSSSESSANDNAANSVPSFEWYLKNHLGSTMLVYGTQGTSDPTVANLGSLKAAYDYRAFGEQVDLTMPNDKVTETFTGKELDDETELSNHGARMLDPMLGVWIAVDPERFFSSPYLYMGNGYNPIRFVDLKGEKPGDKFDTPDEAAKDWARYVNNDSKIMNREAATYIFETDDAKYQTLHAPLWAEADGFKIYDLNNNLRQNPVEGIKKIVGIAHTHGAEDINYKSEEFSNELDEITGEPIGDIPLAKEFNLLIYLMTPSDNFMKYDPVSDEITEQ
jgi:RHS repeat-associated protein